MTLHGRLSIALVLTVALNIALGCANAHLAQTLPDDCYCIQECEEN